MEAGVRIHELATPLRYRWMGVTPSLPLVLRSLPRPDVVHVFGYRDFVTTVTAAWAGRARSRTSSSRSTCTSGATATCR